MARDENRNTFLTVADLRRALRVLPNGARLDGNALGNLSIRDHAGSYLGYVDFASGQTRLVVQEMGGKKEGGSAT